MNSSPLFADRLTHIKIVIVAPVASIFIVVVGIGARTNDANSTAMMAKVNVPAMKAGGPAYLTTNDMTKVR